MLSLTNILLTDLPNDHRTHHIIMKPGGGQPLYVNPMSVFITCTVLVLGDFVNRIPKTVGFYINLQYVL